MKAIFLLAITGLACQACKGPSNAALPSGFELNGLSAAELSAEWWKWAASSPADADPILDASGINCAIGQSGNVWFLAGGYGSSKISRTCTIPYGKYIFFPAVNMAFWPRQENTGYTCNEAKRNAAVNNDSALDLFVEIDGIAVENPEDYRARTQECFDIFERVPDRYRPYRAFPAASDGYWYLLRPLKRGTHTIRFGGQYDNSDHAFGEMVQDIQYSVLVE
jgi:hypothetical protein